MAFSTTTVSTSATTTVVSTSNLPSSATRSPTTSYDPSQSSISSIAPALEESGKGGIKRTDASVDFLEFFDDARTHSDFRSDDFRKAFKDLSANEKKSFELALWKEGKFQTTTDSRGWAQEQINEKGKGDYLPKIQGLMLEAAELYKAQPIVRELGGRYEKLAEKQRKSLDREDIDDDFTREEEKHDGVLRSKVPVRVQQDVAQCVAMFAPDLKSAALSRKDKTNWDRQEPIFATMVKAYIMQAFGKNSMLFVSDTTARDDLATMARVIGKNINPRARDFGLSDKDFADRYNRMGKTAKRIYADLVGYSIARPEEGESYIAGHLKVDGKDGTTVPPDANRLGKLLAFLLAHDGITLPSEFAVYFPRKEEKEEHREDLLGSGRGVAATRPSGSVVMNPPSAESSDESDVENLASDMKNMLATIGTQGFGPMGETNPGQQ